MTTPSTPTATGLQPGDKLDKYEVRDTIGAGGMAVVYKGYDALLDRMVAIKQVNTELAAENGDEGVVERFRREAKLQKRVAPQHKHLVGFIDFIENPRGLFLVQEYVDGVSLEQVLTTKPQPMDHRQALGIIGAVTLALQAIHDKGIIHRDLKPSNILLPHDGGLKVCDFGLAATIAEQESLPLGSVRYMAPELFRGDTVDGRADIYALGMIAYEMLLGRAAFNEAFKIVLRDQRNQALRWMKWHTNVRVRATPLSQLNPNISDTLSDLVARMMDKDPQSRIQSADELLETIRRHFTPGAAPEKKIIEDTRDVARAAPQESRAAVTAKLPTASKLPYVLVALLIVNVLAGLGLWAWYAQDKAAKRQALRDQTRQVLVEARKLYFGADFTGALALYDRVNQEWTSDAEFGAASLAGKLMSEAQLAMRDGNYLLSVQKLDEAEKLGQINDLEKWTELRRLALDEYAFSNVIRDIEGLIAAGKYPQAAFELQKQRNLRQPEARKIRLDEIDARIRQNVQQAQIDDYTQRIQAQLDAGRREKAIEIAAEGAAKFPGSAVDRTLIRLRGEAEFDSLIAAANAAAARGELDTAVDHLTRAGRLKSDDATLSADLKRRADELLIQASMARAREALSVNDIATASTNIERVLSIDPEHEEALRLKQTIATADVKADKVRAGDEAMASRRFEEAIKIYSASLEYGPDPTLADKLVNAKLQLAMETARIHMAKENLAGVAEALDEAARLAPGDPELQTMRARLQALNEFRRLVSEGNAARAAGRFGEAIDRYRKADKFARDNGLPPVLSDEVRQLIDATEYENLLTQAKSEIDLKRWSAAKAILDVMAGMPNGNTPEVQELRDTVRQNMPKAPGE